MQVTVIQIDNYGPWTTTLGNDREHRLQILQANLYSAIQRRFAERDGLVFFNRFDEMLAVTNGITKEEHESIKQSVLKDFPVTISMGIGIGDTPFEAQLEASRLLQREGSAQSAARSGVIACERTLDLAQSYVQVVHIDINGTTRILTDRASAYETSLDVMTLYAELMRRFRDHRALLFFLGGDNFMGIANGVSGQDVEAILQQCRVREIGLKCGIGIARTGRKAAELATMNLDLLRGTDRTRSVLSTTRLN